MNYFTSSVLLVSISYLFSHQVNVLRIFNEISKFNFALIFESLYLTKLLIPISQKDTYEESQPSRRCSVYVKSFFACSRATKICNLQLIFGFIKICQNVSMLNALSKCQVDIQIEWLTIAANECMYIICFLEYIQLHCLLCLGMVEAN